MSFLPRELKNEFFSQGTNDSKNLRFESLLIANYELVSIYSFAVLDTTYIKLWLEEDGGLHTDHPLLFKFNQWKNQN